MSLCRWSSNNFMCDIYCYESESGYVIHVATNRHVKPSPKMPDYTKKVSKAEMAKYQKAYRKWADNTISKPIGLPCDGETYDCMTPRSAWISLKS
jgi:hypothetical protein